MKAGFHIDDTSRRWKPIMSAASKVSSAFVGGTGRHTEIRETAKIESVELLLLQRQLRWLGHVIRVTYAIQPSSTSSILWRTATRSETSWPTKAALLWPHQVRAQEMQHPWIPARGTCRRQGSVKFDMCHWSEESCSSSRTSSKWSPCSKTRSGCSYSSWTCLPSLWQNLCFGLWAPHHLRVHSWPYNRQLHQCNVYVEIDGLLQASNIYSV